jgi:hypothetical protein
MAHDSRSKLFERIQGLTPALCPIDCWTHHHTTGANQTTLLLSTSAALASGDEKGPA